MPPANDAVKKKVSIAPKAKSSGKSAESGTAASAGPTSSTPSKARASVAAPKTRASVAASKVANGRSATGAASAATAAAAGGADKRASVAPPAMQNGRKSLHVAAKEKKKVKSSASTTSLPKAEDPPSSPPEPSKEEGSQSQQQQQQQQQPQGQSQSPPATSEPEPSPSPRAPPRQHQTAPTSTMTSTTSGVGNGEGEEAEANNDNKAGATMRPMISKESPSRQPLPQERGSQLPQQQQQQPRASMQRGGLGGGFERPSLAAGPTLSGSLPAPEAPRSPAARSSSAAAGASSADRASATTAARAGGAGAGGGAGSNIEAQSPLRAGSSPSSPSSPPRPRLPAPWPPQGRALGLAAAIAAHSRAELAPTVSGALGGIPTSPRSPRKGNALQRGPASMWEYGRNLAWAFAAVEDRAIARGGRPGQGGEALLSDLDGCRARRLQCMLEYLRGVVEEHPSATAEQLVDLWECGFVNAVGSPENAQNRMHEEDRRHQGRLDRFGDDDEGNFEDVSKTKTMTKPAVSSWKRVPRMRCKNCNEIGLSSEGDTCRHCGAVDGDGLACENCNELLDEDGAAAGEPCPGCGFIRCPLCNQTAAWPRRGGCPHCGAVDCPQCGTIGRRRPGELCPDCELENRCRRCHGAMQRGRCPRCDGPPGSPQRQRPGQSPPSSPGRSRTGQGRGDGRRAQPGFVVRNGKPVGPADDDIIQVDYHPHQVKKDRFRKQEVCCTPSCGKFGTSFCCWKPHCRFYLCEACVVKYGHPESLESQKGRLWLMRFVKQMKQALRSGTRKLYGAPVYDMRSFFAALDKDDSGSIDSVEFAQGLRRLDVPATDDDIKLFLEMIDVDASGDIGLLELEAGIGAITSLYEVGVEVEPSVSHHGRALEKVNRELP